MRIHKLTVFLLILVLGTLATFATKNQLPSNNRSANDSSRVQQEKKGRFPIADYDEAELTDPNKNRARKEKKLRHNNFSIVAKNPPEWQVQRMFIDEGPALTPALPVAKSGLIVLGEVKTAEAHVSENKENVYSEFTVVVNKVFKTGNSSVFEGAEIIVDRVGGIVKYPNGRSVLYNVSGKNMPTVGERYFFFLTSANNQDLIILTAYRLGPDGITPLDDSTQFEKFRGTAENDFLKSLSEALTTSSSY